jgi:hypothetical protein
MAFRLLFLPSLALLLVPALPASAGAPPSFRAGQPGTVPQAAVPAPAPSAKPEFEPAWSYFERGRVVGFPSATPGSHYRLKAIFQIPTPTNTLTSGRYEDTFVDTAHWRREAWVGESHIVRARDGAQRYAEADGPDSGVLLMVLRVLEPIPDTDTFDSSVWRISHDKVGDVPTIRLAYGPETPDGDLVPGKSQGFWFDASGNLLRAFTDGVEVYRSDFMPYESAQVAQTTVVSVTGGGVAMRIHVVSIARLTSRPPEWDFVVVGHDWRGQAGDEVR